MVKTDTTSSTSSYFLNFGDKQKDVALEFSMNESEVTL